MKLISALFKIVAVFLMIFFILLFPFTLLGRGIAQLIFTSDGLVQGLTENILDVDIFASMAEELVGEITGNAAGATPEEQYMYEMMNNLGHDEWVEIIDSVAPKELMKQTTESLFSGIFGWMNGPEPYPNIQIDLRDWKYNIQSSTIPVMEIILGALPNCSPSEIDSFSSGADIPFCKLPEPHYSNLLSTASSDISERLTEMPDDYNINEETLNSGPGAAQGILQAKTAIQRIRTVLRVGWLMVLGLFLIAIPMGARTIPGSFNWMGLPLLLTGLITLALALTIIGAGGVVLSGLSESLTADLPSALVTPVKASFSGVITLIGNPLMTQGVILFFVGIISLTIGIIWGRSIKHDVDPGGDETLQFPESQDEENDDDSSPSGMFG